MDRKWLSSYWIDTVKLFILFLGEEQVLEKVIYFTASPLNPDKNSRQGAFLNANKLLNTDKFEVVRGKYLKKSIECPRCRYTVIRPEEKKTDVNVAIRMLGDCVQNKTDILVLVSGDGDLLPPNNITKARMAITDKVLITATVIAKAKPEAIQSYCIPGLLHPSGSQ